MGFTECTINVTDGNESVAYEVYLNIKPRLAIKTPTDLPSAVEGRRYHAALDVTGGTPPYRWAIPDPPDGLSLNASTGAIFWSPTVAGTARFTVEAADNDGHKATGDFTIPIR